MGSWLHCFGSEVRQSIMAVGVIGRGDSSLHGSWEAQRDKKGSKTIYPSKSCSQWPSSSYHLLVMPSNYETISGLVHG
jgi:hypothetical protein